MCIILQKINVALRKESVDRNIIVYVKERGREVALRKESVDRNISEEQKPLTIRQSLSARRAWIEIPLIVGFPGVLGVALRKESVDRNIVKSISYLGCFSRSPQGERG